MTPDRTYIPGARERVERLVEFAVEKKLLSRDDAEDWRAAVLAEFEVAPGPDLGPSLGRHWPRRRAELNALIRIEGFRHERARARRILSRAVASRSIRADFARAAFGAQRADYERTGRTRPIREHLLSLGLSPEACDGLEAAAIDAPERPGPRSDRTRGGSKAADRPDATVERTALTDGEEEPPVLPEDASGGVSPSPETPVNAGEVSLKRRTAGVGATGGDEAATDSRAMDLEPGALVADRYEVRALLGTGGMGAVYRAHDRVRRKDVGLKVMLPSLLEREGAAERFEQEAEIMLGLSHPGVVRVFDAGLDAARRIRFYTMELLEGVTLRAWLNEKKSRSEEVAATDALEIVAQVLEALRHAHRTTIHRDLKPENIFVLGTGPLEVKLLDFGIAKFQSARQFTATAMSVGTAHYMAPEQRDEAASVDGRADLFSLAVILYEMLVGRRPIGRFKTPTEVRKSLPRGIDDVTLAALAPEPEGRPASASEFLEHVRAIQAVLAKGKGPKDGRQRRGS